MKAILHIGTEKTGTSTIQQFLYENSQALSSQGILVPSKLGIPNHRFLQAIFNEPDYSDDLFFSMGLLDKKDRMSAKKKWWLEFVKEIHQSEAHTAIISSEHLQSKLTKMEEIRALKHGLLALFDSIDILLYIRSPLETAISLYSTSVKYAGAQDVFPGPDCPYFHNVINHAETVRRWSGVFGNDRLQVRLLTPSGFYGGDLISDFSHATGISQRNTKAVRIENKSLDKTGIEVLRRINKNINRFDDDGQTNYLWEGLVPFFEKHFSDGEKFKPPNSVIDDYEAAFLDSNELIRERFFPERDYIFETAERNSAQFDPVSEAYFDRLALAIEELWRETKRNT